MTRFSLPLEAIGEPVLDVLAGEPAIDVFRGELVISVEFFLTNGKGYFWLIFAGERPPMPGVNVEFVWWILGNRRPVLVTDYSFIGSLRMLGAAVNVTFSFCNFCLDGLLCRFLNEMSKAWFFCFWMFLIFWFIKVLIEAE